MSIHIFELIACIAIPQIVGGISGYLIIPNLRNWYPTLRKPSFNPPNVVFGPVWTTLYLLMGISLYLLLQTPADPLRTCALVIFAAQLFLNFWWSIIFFNFRRIGIALVDIIFLWLLIAAMILVMGLVRPLAAYLQIPYLLWVSFATALNAAIWRLN